jgi:hypothetical protein
MIEIFHQFFLNHSPLLICLLFQIICKKKYFGIPQYRLKSSIRGMDTKTVLGEAIRSMLHLRRLNGRSF